MLYYGESKIHNVIENDQREGHLGGSKGIPFWGGEPMTRRRRANGDDDETTLGFTAHGEGFRYYSTCSENSLESF